MKIVPKPDARVTPSAEEFEAWCEHPTTRWVAAAYQAAAQHVQAAWNDLISVRQQADGPTLESVRNELFTRRDAYRAFLETTFTDYAKYLTDERP